MKTHQITELRDPIGARPATGYAPTLVATRDLEDGREAQVAWLYAGPSHVHVVVWVPSRVSAGPRGDTRFVEHVARFNAAGATERLCKELEA
jgi:hypothetical protein